MVKKAHSVYSWIISSFIVLIVILGSIRYLDARIAVRVMRFLQSLNTLHKATEDIPDLLVYIVCSRYDYFMDYLLLQIARAQTRYSDEISETCSDSPASCLSVKIIFSVYVRQNSYPDVCTRPLSLKIPLVS